MDKRDKKDVNGWNISFFLSKRVSATHFCLYLQY